MVGMAVEGGGGQALKPKMATLREDGHKNKWPPSGEVAAFVVRREEKNQKFKVGGYIVTICTIAKDGRIKAVGCRR
jgi:hypothetical protein